MISVKFCHSDDIVLRISKSSFIQNEMKFFLVLGGKKKKVLWIDPRKGKLATKKSRIRNLCRGTHSQLEEGKSNWKSSS